MCKKNASRFEHPNIWLDIFANVAGPVVWQPNWILSCFQAAVFAPHNKLAITSQAQPLCGGLAFSMPCDVVQVPPSSQLERRYILFSRNHLKQQTVSSGPGCCNELHRNISESQNSYNFMTIFFQGISHINIYHYLLVILLPIGSMGIVNLPTFTIKIHQM